MTHILLLAQAQTLTKIHHKNLVSLVGYCKDGKYLALVYEHISEGNLDDKLRGLLLHLYEQYLGIFA
jgi:serine/threonine protein kinase